MYVLVHLRVSNRFGDCRDNQKINLNLLCKCECKEKTEGSDFTLTANSWGGGGGVKGALDKLSGTCSGCANFDHAPECIYSRTY